jgi:hypothetical protein
MTDKTDETGKGPLRPGDAPRRPYATIDLRASAGGRDGGPSAAAGSAKPEAGGTSRLWPTPEWLATAWTAVAGWLTTVRIGALGMVRSDGFLSHAAAGVAGAALTLAVASALGLFAGGQRGERASPDVAARLAAVEKTLQRPAAPPDGLTAKLAAAETRLAKLEEQAQALQGRVAADLKSIDARIAAAGVTERLAKLEAALAALSREDKSARIANVEKLAGEASEAKSASARVERELAGLKSEAASLRQSLEGLQGSVEERLKDAAKAADLAPVLAKLAAFERDLRTIVKTEGDRAVSAQQVLLSLEIANLKRALERGHSYARELDAAKITAGGSIDLAPLERYSRTGVPTLGALTQEFKRVANAAADAENEPADAGVLDRLMAGARSIVRLRKARYEADDASVEATLARMELALQEGNVGEVLAQGKRLPAKAARAAEDWLRRLEARHAADRKLADIEATLKASLTGLPPPEAKR